MVLSGPLAAAVARALGEVPGLATRVAAAGDVSAADLAWADSYAGFTVPGNLGSSAVRWVHAMAAGVDAALRSLGTSPAVGGPVLTRTVGSMPRAIGTYVLGQVLADHLQLARYRDQQARHVWAPLANRAPGNRGVVVLGTGEIGAGIAGVLRGGGFRVVGMNTHGRARAPFDEVVALRDGAAHLAGCDVLVCALPLTDATRGLLGHDLFAHLDDALVVNVGRGACVVPAGLRAALADGHVRHAVLDVVETEPLPGDDWRWDHERVTLTPHVSGPTEPADVVAAILQCREALARGERPALAVDLARGY